MIIKFGHSAIQSAIEQFLKRDACWICNEEKGELINHIGMSEFDRDTEFVQDLDSAYRLSVHDRCWNNSSPTDTNRLIKEQYGIGPDEYSRFKRATGFRLS